MKISAVILAAGASARLGRPKQLLEINGTPLLRRAAETALAAECHEAIVVLGAHSDALEPALVGLPVRIVLNRHWAEGLSSSLKSGIAAVSEDSDAALVILVDQPNVDAASLRRIISAFGKSGLQVAASVYGDSPGVPAVFARETFDAFGSLTGDKGAKALFGRFQTTFVDMPEAALDLDTEADLERWESAR